MSRETIPPSDDGAAALLSEHLEAAIGAMNRPLVFGDDSAVLTRALRAAKRSPTGWLRHVSTRGGARSPALAWPPEGAFDGAILRLPKAKDALTFALHAAAARIPAGARIVVIGANSEGIRSAADRLAEVVDEAQTVATGHHARVLAGTRRAEIAGHRANLSAWRQVSPLQLGTRKAAWVSYPGCFAKGGLDQGTAFLLGHLPAVAAKARVLDYAAGTGVIAAALLDAVPSADVDMVEADAVALEAARENAPQATAILGDQLAVVGDKRYDLIISNPPIHEGVQESHRVLEQLIRDARVHIRFNGELVLVVQRRVAVARLIEAELGACETVADDGRFTVLRGRVTRPQTRGR